MTRPRIFMTLSVAVLICAGVIALMVQPTPEQKPEIAADTTTSATEPTPTPVEQPAAPAEQPVQLSNSDEIVRTLAAGLSRHPKLAPGW